MDSGRDEQKGVVRTAYMSGNLSVMCLRLYFVHEQQAKGICCVGPGGLAAGWGTFVGEAPTGLKVSDRVRGGKGKTGGGHVETPTWGFACILPSLASRPLRRWAGEDKGPAPAWS